MNDFNEEKWCVKHEVEGMEYGNEFEERNDKLNHQFADLMERINLLGECIQALDRKISYIENHLVI
jgi:hypothetical protein